MAVTLIRHAESTHNRFNDPTRNCPITDYGKIQASKLTGTYDLVICSTLKRARQTLDESGIQYGKVIFTDLCREVLDGNPVNLYNNEPNTTETAEQIRDRVEKVKTLLREMSAQYPKIAVVSHGVFLYYVCGHRFYNTEQFKYVDRPN